MCLVGGAETIADHLVPLAELVTSSVPTDLGEIISIATDLVAVDLISIAVACGARGKSPLLLADLVTSQSQ